MSQEQRQYECIVFGATGYTGKYTAEHVTTHLPTDFKWAIAGRTESKLKSVADELRTLNPDRLQPGIELTQLNKDDLLKLARKTKVLISTVGPYHKYGSHAFAACAETGTHYLDCTGEVPWVYEMTKKYDALAKSTGAILVPQNGVESAPTDLICWMLVTHIRQTLDKGTAELVDIIHDLNSAPSGGTLDTVLSLFETYSLSEVAKAMAPFSLCTVVPPKQNRKKPLLEVLTGIRTDEVLGTLTTSIQGPTDAPIINRTYGLIDGGKFYGPNFQLSTYMRVSSKFNGFLVHLALTFGFAALILPPLRWLARKFVFAPGQGTPREQASKEHCEWRAIANTDQSDDSEDPKRAYGRMRWNGSMYDLTGTFLAEAACVLSRETKTLAHEIGGGVLTPATLGASYISRLQKAGLETELETLP
ncbi:hypothetical protein DOTSEDRAFT_150189 [Dothistroma septosporum NZE10]|uniref:Saccharopine dehydrogenase NADP binding domain-containing protein n=1 Tax=Dothistroma septosporum (strain NZE10 / CBS 128990) TaxID=675120 RepID=N1PPD5_DOTSN|nr:hypothetical protein DOTSEDRAFT_150189 [Dothistroma septosporum NZE10]